MKTKIAVLSLLIVGCNLFGFAGNGEKIIQLNNKSSLHLEATTSFKEKINSQIAYPELKFDQRVAAKVKVDFKVNENGKIEILTIHSDNEAIQEYVEQKLQTIVANQNEKDVIGQIFHYCFSFEVQH